MAPIKKIEAFSVLIIYFTIKGNNLLNPAKFRVSVCTTISGVSVRNLKLKETSYKYTYNVF